MGKPNPADNTSAEAPVTAVPGGAEAAVIRAVPGQPWPEPPSGGTWVRNAKTGDLTCMDAGTQPMTDEERRARRDQQRASAMKATEQKAKE